MRRDLPPRPHLDHLKKQAKDLLAAHRRGDTGTAARLRAALPSLARLSDEELRRAPLALHDAQSAVAREYGLASWNELRAEVAKRAGKPFPEAIIRALTQQPLPPAVTAALRDAWAGRAEAAGALSAELPATLPLIAMRNALLPPGSLAPIHLSRPASLAAIDAALRAAPARVAVFAQRAPETEEITAEALHPVGCEAIVHKCIPDGDGRVFVVLEALRWVSLLAVEPAGAHLAARVAPVEVDAEDEAGEVPALAATLRDRARKAASALPDADKAIALLDAIEDPERLADIVMANVPCSVDEKARYAAEGRLAERLRLVLAALDAAGVPPAGQAG